MKIYFNNVALAKEKKESYKKHLHKIVDLLNRISQIYPILEPCFKAVLWIPCLLNLFEVDIWCFLKVESLHKSAVVDC